MHNRYGLYTMFQTQHTLTIETTTIYIYIRYVKTESDTQIRMCRSHLISFSLHYTHPEILSEQFHSGNYLDCEIGEGGSYYGCPEGTQNKKHYTKKLTMHSKQMQ